MSTVHSIQTLLELIVAGLVIYGFYREDKVIAFEQRLKRNIKRKIYNFIVRIEEVVKWQT